MNFDLVLLLATPMDTSGSVVLEKLILLHSFWLIFVVL